MARFNNAAYLFGTFGKVILSVYHVWFVGVLQSLFAKQGIFPDPLTVFDPFNGFDSDYTLNWESAYWYSLGAQNENKHWTATMRLGANTIKAANEGNEKAQYIVESVLLNASDIAQAYKEIDPYGKGTINSYQLRATVDNEEKKNALESFLSAYQVPVAIAIKATEKATEKATRAKATVDKATEKATVDREGIKRQAIARKISELSTKRNALKNEKARALLTGQIEKLEREIKKLNK